MKRKSGRKNIKKDEDNSNGVEDTEQNGEASDHDEDDTPKKRKSSKGGRKNVSFSGKKDKEDTASTAESDKSIEDEDQDEESKFEVKEEEKKSKGRKSKKEIAKEVDPLADSNEEDDGAENEKKKKSSKKAKKGGKKEKQDSEKAGDDRDEDEDVEYEVESVLDEKVIRGIRHYLIRWKGYDEESDTWEPEDTLECDELIQKYKDLKKDKGNRRSIKGKDKKDDKDDWDENEEFEVARILEVHHKRDGKREFLISWKGYGQDSNSWEPEENLDCKDLINRFMTKVKEAKNLEERELRINRKQVQRYTLNTQEAERRMSRRFKGRERVQYHDAE